jgi:hypothetical protein
MLVVRRKKTFPREAKEQGNRFATVNRNILRVELRSIHRPLSRNQAGSGGLQRLHGQCQAGKPVQRAGFPLQADARRLCFLPTLFRSPTLRQVTFGGNHVRLCRAARGFSVQSVAGNGALLSDVACGELGLLGRGAAGLYRRCVPAVQRGDPGCRPRCGLHGPEAIPAQSGLPGLLQGRSPGCRGKTAQHQGACACAKTAQAQEARIIPGCLNRGARSHCAWTRFVRGARCDSKSTSLTNQRHRHNWP